MQIVVQENIDESGSKPDRIWVDRGSKFYNRSMKSWLQDNDIGMYSTHNEVKAVVAEKFIRTLRNKIWKYMTLLLKYLYIDN